MKVIYGLALSIGLGFVMAGPVQTRLDSFRRRNRRRANVFFKYAQIASAAAMSFMHGAQDGQKFIGVLFLGVAFASGQTSVGDAGIPIWIMLLCSATMGIGTSVGGERIIKSVGQSMVKLEKYQASPPTWRAPQTCCLPRSPASPCPPLTSRPAPSWASAPSSAFRPSTSA